MFPCVCFLVSIRARVRARAHLCSYVAGFCAHALTSVYTQIACMSPSNACMPLFTSVCLCVHVRHRAAAIMRSPVSVCR